MNLTSPTTIKELLTKYETRPSKGLGQNFLIDKNVLRKIIMASNIESSDTILEVGPGIGTLTQELAQHAKKIIAIEKSETMCKILKDFSAQGGPASGWKNVEIINADILKFNPANYPLLTTGYKLVANIPYYLTSPLIRKFLELPNQPQEIILMIQKEVAQRICSTPGKMSLLSVSVQFYAKTQIIDYVSKNCFWPAPKVDSAIIKITPFRPDQSKKQVQADLFFRIVKAGFSQPRKQLAGNLYKILKLEKEYIEKWLLENNIKPTQRAETLSIEDWKNLTNSFCE